jgi:hypothetical protein
VAQSVPGFRDIWVVGSEEFLNFFVGLGINRFSY